jgi:hypothetical protein
MPTATLRDLAPGTRIGRLRWWMIGLVATIGYSPCFVGLAVLDLVGALLLWTLVREPAGRGDLS